MAFSFGCANKCCKSSTHVTKYFRPFLCLDTIWSICQRRWGNPFAQNFSLVDYRSARNLWPQATKVFCLNYFLANFHLLEYEKGSEGCSTIPNLVPWAFCHTGMETESPGAKVSTIPSSWSQKKSHSPQSVTFLVNLLKVFRTVSKVVSNAWLLWKNKHRAWRQKALRPRFPPFHLPGLRKNLIPHKECHLWQIS